MGKELNSVEISNEVVENNAEQSLIQLSELNLTLVGGGDATVAF